MAYLTLDTSLRIPRILRKSLIVKAMRELPVGFKDDGCSNSPDSIFGIDIRWACRWHDARYCTRLWNPGDLTNEWRHQSDTELRLNIMSVLPFSLRWIGWIYFRAVHRFGGDNAFDSCGETSAARTGRGLCRHGMPAPEWMRH